jgi:tRNA-specific 2-thiouridylase
VEIKMNVLKPKVAIAMSGGVDSSVAAALLLEQGYEVVGITMQLWPRAEEYERPGDTAACCSLSAVEDARRVAAHLGISHYLLNLRDIFEAEVIDNFCCEYVHGRTPNPCIRCNQKIKFEALLRRVEEIDADYLATGHYARLEFDRTRARYIIRRGLDERKDQSYFLYAMTQKQIARTLMPLGGLTKERTRELAAYYGLPVATKAESQEICFIPDNDYAAFVAQRDPAAVMPGDIVDTAGRVLGRHQGIIRYTVGQRRGLGIASDRPLYVVDIDAGNNRVVIGPEEELFRHCLTVTEINWVALSDLENRREAEVALRYRMQAAPAVIEPSEGRQVAITFAEPQRAVTPGQSAVFYHGDTVLGGGIIVKSF